MLRLLAAALLAAATVSACGSGAAPTAQQSPASTATPSGTTAPQGLASAPPGPLPGGGVIPTHISIPAIDVSAPVEAVGEAADGNLGSPSGWDSVGWFSPGFRPGAPGHAVFNGHLDTNLASRPTAVFWNLNKLKDGDVVSLKATDGSTLKFTVNSLNYYAAEHAPLNQIFGPADNSVIELVTCAGTWRGTKLGYSERLVVSAALSQA